MNQLFRRISYLLHSFFLWAAPLHAAVTDNQIEQFQKWVRELKSKEAAVVIGISRRIDGDLIGSALALKVYFEKMGLKVYFDRESGGHTPSSSPEFLHRRIREEFEKAMQEQNAASKVAELKTASHIGLISVDTAHYSFADFLSYLRVASKTPIPSTSLRIDHHKVEARAPSDLISDPESASTTEMILALTKPNLPEEIGANFYAYLLAGLRSDSAFRYAPFSIAHFEILADLLERSSIELTDVFKPYDYQNLSAKRAVWILEILQKHFKISSDGSVAAALVPSHIVQKLNTSNLYDLEKVLSDISGNKALVIMYEDSEGRSLRLNFRSYRNLVDVQVVAKRYGGGGHAGAAGAMIAGKGSGQNDELLEEVFATLDSAARDARSVAKVKLSPELATQVNQFYQDPSRSSPSSIRDLAVRLDRASPRGATLLMQEVLASVEAYPFASLAAARQMLQDRAGSLAVVLNDFAGKLSFMLRERISETSEFYAELQRLESDPDMATVKFKADQIFFGGGFVRQLARVIKKGDVSKIYAINDIADASRDLDLVWINDSGLNPAALDRARSRITSVLEKILAQKNARVRNVELKLLSEKSDDPFFFKQGYDTPSQALVGFTVTSDVMDEFQPGRPSHLNAIYALEHNQIDYELPEILADTGAFLNQVIEVVRIFKLRLENPKYTWTAPADENIRKVLTAFLTRQSEIRQFLTDPNQAKAKYFLNRISDVLGWVINEMGKQQLSWFTILEESYGLWSFFGQFPQLRSQIVEKSILVKPSGAHSQTEKLHAQISSQWTLRNLDSRFSFDFSLGQIFVQQPAAKGFLGFGGRPASQTPVLFQSSGSGVHIQTTAYTGTTSVVHPNLLLFNQFDPLNQFEVLKILKASSNLFVVLVRHKILQYSTVATLDSAGSPPQLKFLNGRAFTDTSRAGARAGQSGAPMISTTDIDFYAGNLYMMGADRMVRQVPFPSKDIVIQSQGLRCPRGQVISFLIHKSNLWTAYRDGRLVVSKSDGSSTLIAQNIIALYRGDNSLPHFIERLSDGALRLISEDETGRYLNSPLSSLGGSRLFVQTMLSINIFDLPPLQPITSPAEAIQEHSMKETETHLRTSGELLADLQTLVGLFRNEAPSTYGLLEDLAKNQMDPRLLTDADGAKGRISQLEEKLAALKPKFKKLALRALAYRLVLELRRGISVDFGFLPNSFVLVRMIEVLKIHSTDFDDETADIIRGLKDPDAIADLLQRNSATASQWNDGTLPRWHTFTAAAIKGIKVQNPCAIDVRNAADAL